jgi:hypothetical protein
MLTKLPRPTVDCPFSKIPSGMCDVWRIDVLWRIAKNFEDRNQLDIKDRLLIALHINGINTLLRIARLPLLLFCFTLPENKENSMENKVSF